MKPDLLAKLTAHGVPLEGTLGGKAQLTAQDVAAALAGTDVKGYQLLMAKYCDESSSPLFKPLLRHARAHAGDLLPDHEAKVMSLVLFILDEYCTGRKCPRCKGTGADPDNPTKTCSTCNGTGNADITYVSGAARLGMDYRTYKRHWLALADELQKELYSWEMTALSIAKI